MEEGVKGFWIKDWRNNKHFGKTALNSYKSVVDLLFCEIH
jgi:hypothetical protein